MNRLISILAVLACILVGSYYAWVKHDYAHACFDLLLAVINIQLMDGEHV